jgi:hypothetical protein
MQWHQLRHDESDVAVCGWTYVEEDLLSGDVVGRLHQGASARSAEDAVAGEYERAVRLLEARCEDAFEAVTRAGDASPHRREPVGTLPHPSIRSMPSLSSMDHWATFD